jgi:hypothetical protein
MQITLDIKDSALDKILYFLEHLKDDVKIIAKQDTSRLKIKYIQLFIIVIKIILFNLKMRI